MQRSHASSDAPRPTIHKPQVAQKGLKGVSQKSMKAPRSHAAPEGVKRRRTGLADIEMAARTYSQMITQFGAQKESQSDARIIKCFLEKEARRSLENICLFFEQMGYAETRDIVAAALDRSRKTRQLRSERAKEKMQQRRAREAEN